MASDHSCTTIFRWPRDLQTTHHTLLRNWGHDLLYLWDAVRFRYLSASLRTVHTKFWNGQRTNLRKLNSFTEGRMKSCNHPNLPGCANTKSYRKCNRNSATPWWQRLTTTRSHQIWMPGSFPKVTMHKTHIWCCTPPTSIGDTTFPFRRHKVKTCLPITNNIYLSHSTGSTSSNRRTNKSFGLALRNS